MSKDKDELIHIACFIKDTPIEEKNGQMILYGEAWRDSNVKKTEEVRLTMSTDLYLDCLSVAKETEEDVHLYFCIHDSWKALKKLFRHPKSEFAFIVEDNFELLVEGDEDMIVLKEF